MIYYVSLKMKNGKIETHFIVFSFISYFIAFVVDEISLQNQIYF